MKKLLLSLLFVFAFSSMGFGARAIDWTKSTTANVPMYLPSSGIFKDIGVKELYLTTTNTNSTFEVVYYQSSGTIVLSTESLSKNVKKVILNPNFRIRSVSSEAVLLTAEVYILQ